MKADVKEPESSINIGDIIENDQQVDPQFQNNI